MNAIMMTVVLGISMFLLVIRLLVPNAAEAFVGLARRDYLSRMQGQSCILEHLMLTVLIESFGPGVDCSLGTSFRLAPLS